MLDIKTKEVILKSLESMAFLSDLQKDIFESISKLDEKPVNRDSIINKIKENKMKYPYLVVEESIFASKIGEFPVFKPYDKSSTEELQSSLSNQIILLWSKLHKW